MNYLSKNLSKIIRLSMACSLAWGGVSLETKAQLLDISSQVRIIEDGRNYAFTAGEGIYQVRYNYTGENWTHADVAAIAISTNRPIAILPVQYTSNSLQPGAKINGYHVGRYWNTVTVNEMYHRLTALGFYVLTPTIQMYGENLDGFQALEHFIAGVHKGNANVQTLILTADAHIPSETNPFPGAQMLITGLHQRDRLWENRIQQRLQSFYQQQGLRNIGPRVRGGKSNEEGHSLAWHPLIERAAEYSPHVAIVEVAQAREILAQARSWESAADWASPVFDAIVEGMAEHACATGASLPEVCPVLQGY